ncbi:MULTISPECIES: HmuY family protein [Chitinophagaceae]
MKKLFVASLALATLAACSKDKDPIIVVPPSSGSTMTLNGGDGGASAVNSVFVDFSTDKQDSVKRASWDLGFYCGSDFKVIINNTNGASVKQLSKTDLNAVTEADFNTDDLTISLGSTNASEFAKVDDPREGNILNKTAISTVSATDADNKTYILIPEGGTHSSVITADAAYKIRIIRKSSGYTLQYAKLKDATFKTLDINKDENHNFNYVSLSSGQPVIVEPTASNWDIEWTWSIYYDSKGGYIYSYSDIVFINNLGGSSTFERVYDSESAAADAYTNFTKDSVAKYSFSSNRDVIGSKWRNTTGTVGVKKQNFYIIKDAAGNIYKLKFLSFITQDGGTRGKPEIHYELISK